VHDAEANGLKRLLEYLLELCCRAFSFSTWQTLDAAGLDANEAASLAHAAAASVSV
jgi:hypothetical protein